MAKPKLAIFSGPAATIGNSPTLVTSNKGRLPGEPTLDGRYDHLVAQELYEPVTVKISKFSAHPMERDAEDVYHNNGKDYYEVQLTPEDGTYLLPYMARRANGAPNGTPFEDSDLVDVPGGCGGRQFFYPDASRIFEDVDRTINGRDEHGEGNPLDRRADFDFVRVLPSAGYKGLGEQSGVDFFHYKPYPIARTPGVECLARIANMVQRAMSSGEYAGGIWMEGSPTVEETTYWLSLLIDTDLPFASVASQRTHGQLSGDGDRNIVDAVDYILSNKSEGLGAVGVMDEQIFAARELKKADDRPGNYKATGGHGGILGSVGPPVTIWYKPTYNHTSSSHVRLSQLPEDVWFQEWGGSQSRVGVKIKDNQGWLLGSAIPRVHIVKTGSYMAYDSSPDFSHEVDILARIDKALGEQMSDNSVVPKLHGIVMEGYSPYGVGSLSQMMALNVAGFSGLPVVRVGRSDPGGMVPHYDGFAAIDGSNLDANKARLLLMASMMKLGRFPRAKNPQNPTKNEWEAMKGKISEFQEIFDSH